MSRRTTIGTLAGVLSLATMGFAAGISPTQPNAGCCCGQSCTCTQCACEDCCEDCSCSSCCSMCACCSVDTNAGTNAGN